MDIPYRTLNAKGIGPVNARNLVAYCGGVDPIFTDSKLKSTLEKVPGIGPKLIASIMDKKVIPLAEKQLEYVRKHDLRMLSIWIVIVIRPHA